MPLWLLTAGLALRTFARQALAFLEALVSRYKIEAAAVAALTLAFAFAANGPYRFLLLVLALLAFVSGFKVAKDGT